MHERVLYLEQWDTAIGEELECQCEYAKCSNVKLFVFLIFVTVEYGQRTTENVQFTLFVCMRCVESN